MWINAHSDSKCIELGKRDINKPIENDNHLISHFKLINDELETKSPNAHMIKDALNKLDENAVIILDSCEAGQVTEDIKPIAQILTNYASGRIVYAAIKEINCFASNCKWIKNKNEEYELKVKFTQAKDSLKSGVIGFIENLFYFFTYLTYLSKEDVTAKFKQYSDKINREDFIIK